MKERYVYEGLIKHLEHNQIFVFGSNPEGRHGLGAAKVALGFGAKYGQGRGIQGQSYGLITKNLEKGYHDLETGITYDKYGPRSISPNMIKYNIIELYSYARKHRDIYFMIAYTTGGRNLNGYTNEEMAEFFRNTPLSPSKRSNVPRNIVFEKGFHDLVFPTSKKS
jgi:hypothetical protein